MIVLATMVDDGHPHSAIIDTTKLQPHDPSSAGLLRAINDALANSDRISGTDFESSLANGDFVGYTNRFGQAELGTIDPDAILAVPFTGTIEESVTIYVEE